jgi:hypothetical protein
VILTTWALYLMSKKDLSFKSAAQFARRELMLVIIFSSMTLMMSLGLFTSFYPFEITVAIFSTGVMIVQIIHFVRYFRKYYFFDTIFDARNSKVKIYLTVFFACKFSSSLLISVFRKYTLVSCILVFIIQMLFTVTFSIIRPFINKWMNVFTICAEWTATLFVLLNMLINVDTFGPTEG